ncbi:unnamed protein product [Auanema sp. JU1783]|nr:unnamed protein product [Auanema sp. JU1783]
MITRTLFVFLLIDSWRPVYTADLLAALTGSSSLNGQFNIAADSLKPSTQLHIALPSSHSSYTSFIVKVADITLDIEDKIRDENRTLSSTTSNGNDMVIQNLHPGHKYSISVIGVKDDRQDLIKEEHIVMTPRPPDFPTDGVTAGKTNITLITDKDAHSLQDAFLIEYRQVDSEKKYSMLEVLDIPEQKQLEVYLGHLSPGRDYAVRMIAVKDGIKSQPWSATLTTRPSSVSSLKIQENGTCVTLSWLPGEGGVDSYIVKYFQVQAENTSITAQVPAPASLTTICQGIIPGVKYSFSVRPRKTLMNAEETVIEHILRPLAPVEFKCRPDITKGRYRLTAELPSDSHYEKCHVTATSETLDRLEVESEVEEKHNKSFCVLFLLLSPGQRYEFSLATSSLGVYSNKLHRSLVLTPAFDLKGFGLSIQESENGLEMAWPQSDVFMTRLRDIWGKVVGHDSSLQMRVTSIKKQNSTTRESNRQFETNPLKPSVINVSNLTKGSCYRIQMYTVTKSGIVSETRYNETMRISSPAVNATLHDVTRTSAVLNLTLSSKSDIYPDCNLAIVVYDMFSQIVFQKQLPIQAFLPVIELNGLRPFHKYTINNQIICGEAARTSECAAGTRSMRQIMFSTKPDKPGPVQSLAGRALNPYSVQLSWLPPALPNGILTHYIAEIVPLQSTEKKWSVTIGLSSDRSDHHIETVVDGLQGGERYNFSVRAATEAGSGEEPLSGHITLKMPIQAPPKPGVGPAIVFESIGSHALSVKYNSNMLDGKHGRIIRSDLIVSEVTEDGRTTDTILKEENQTYTWLQVQRFDVWPAYVASITDIPNSVRTTAQINKALTEAIGIDAACEDLPDDTVCNGPLKAGTPYKFKLRLYSAPNLFTDTPYSDVVTTAASPRGISLRAIVVLLSLFILLGLLGIILISYWTRSKKQRSATYSSSSSANSAKESQWAALKMIMAERAADCLAKLGLDGSQNVPPHGDQTVPNNGHLQPTFGHHRRCRSLRERTGVDHRLERLPSGPIHKAPLYTVMTSANLYKSRPVRKCDFEAHVRNMSADSEFRFSEEYESLKNVGVGQSYHASDLPVNRAKNRFTNILPFDHSRVKLINVDDEDGSDYINANYMPGFSSRREFIAAQGPLPSTRDAFWQMAWEQQCPSIIALTKCVEKGRDKCHQYWPDAEHMSVIYADIEVTLMCETHYEEFTVRDLRLTKLNDPSSPPRIIRHLHYMAWPDFGVPEHPEGIIRFVRLFRSKLPHSAHNKPTIVHCSAGVGRSGTFITIDRLLQTIQLDRPIDVYGIVYEMRLERCHMVQNEQQYIFIHHCILHALQTSNQPSVMTSPSSVEIHQNPAFEDDEGIEESGF